MFKPRKSHYRIDIMEVTKGHNGQGQKLLAKVGYYA